MTKTKRRGKAISSLVSGGCVVSGSVIRRSLISTGVKVRSFGILARRGGFAVRADQSFRAADQRRDRPRRRYPRRVGCRRGSRSRRETFSTAPKRGICLITQSMIDAAVAVRWHEWHVSRVLSVASEVFPIVKTGGLADVVGALPGALAGEDIDVVTLVPGYRAVLDAVPRPDRA